AVRGEPVGADRWAREPARPTGNDGEALTGVRGPGRGRPPRRRRRGRVPMSAPLEALPPFDPAPGSIPTLEVPDPSGWRRLHLVGVGGAGMRGLAKVLLARGVVIRGSDLKDSPGLDGLRSAGATVFVGHSAEQV